MRIGFTCGTFDLLHPGHVLMLADAKGHCDSLVVGLQIDPSVDRPEKHAPVQTLEERIMVLQAIRFVDDIKIYRTEEDLVALLKALKPDLRIIGSDWRGKAYTGMELDIPIYWHERGHTWSTSELRRRVTQRGQPDG